jgi:hypothetical protein
LKDIGPNNLQTVNGGYCNFTFFINQVVSGFNASEVIYDEALSKNHTLNLADFLAFRLLSISSRTSLSFYCLISSTIFLLISSLIEMTASAVSLLNFPENSFNDFPTLITSPEMNPDRE